MLLHIVHVLNATQFALELGTFSKMLSKVPNVIFCFMNESVMIDIYWTGFLPLCKVPNARLHPPNIISIVKSVKMWCWDIFGWNVVFTGTTGKVACNHCKSHAKLPHYCFINILDDLPNLFFSDFETKTSRNGVMVPYYCVVQKVYKKCDEIYFVSKNGVIVRVDCCWERQFVFEGN